MRSVFVIRDLIFLCFFLLGLTSFASEKKILRVRADLWCPYNCEVGAKDPGIIVELVQKILEPQGYQLDYKIMNWPRAIEDTRSGKYDAIVGAAHGDAPDFVFPKEPQAYAAYSFFGLKESQLKFTNLESFKGVKLGVIDGYTYDDETVELMKKRLPWVTFSTGDQALSQLVQMLQAKRIGAFIENPGVFYDFLKKNNLSKNDFKILGSPQMKPQELYIALSPKFSEAKKVTELMSQGMLKFKKNGTLKALQKKYNLTGI